MYSSVNIFYRDKNSNLSVSCAYGMIISSDVIDQCFSTFLASSPDKRKFLGQCSLQYMLYAPKNSKIDAYFAQIIAQILVLLTKFNNVIHIQVEIGKSGIFKNISSPCNTVSKSRYRDASRRLRNTVIDGRIDF